MAGPLGSFFAFDPAQRGGVNVGTDSMAGDLGGDGVADLAVGTGPGAAPRVKVFSGTTGAELRDLAPFDDLPAGGVRVALAYVTEDSHADLVAGTGPGVPGTVRVFDGNTGGQLPPPVGEYGPFGAAAPGGVWVAASNDPIMPGVNTPFSKAQNPTSYTPFSVKGSVFSSQYPMGGTPTGTLTFKVQNTTTSVWTTLGTATPAPATPAGWASAELTYPAGLPPAMYTLSFDYSGGAAFSKRTSMPGTMTVRDPQVVIAYPMTKALQVAKWEDAFEPTADGKGVQIKGPNPTNDETKNRDFIDRDPSRFNVGVCDPGAWELDTPHLRAKISTTDVAGFTMYDDDPTPVDLIKYTGAAKNEPGWYWSDSQMLVSNEVDDKHSAATYLRAGEQDPSGDGLPKNGYAEGKAWLVSDRTHKVALRGTVWADYAAGGKTVADSKPVPARNKVNVHVIAVKHPNGQPVIGVGVPSASNTAIHEANEQFAQAGIYLVPDHTVPDAKANNPPAGVDLTDGLDGWTDQNSALSQEQKDLFAAANLRTEAKNDIELYWVDHFANRNEIGEAFTEAVYGTAAFVDSVIVSVDDRTRFTVAHEIGHVLTNAPHYYGDLWPANLMRANPIGADTVTTNKRLTLGQQAAIWWNRIVLLSPPDPA
ncbi:MAG: hypothetical protein K2X82_11780 [Gemmataceae bacterium]|nr:hypothetical protein [Gemmataceae bacterium]